MRALRERRALGPRRGDFLPIDPAECTRHTGMDPQKWAKVCEWVSVHHPPDRRLPYDLAERRAKADRYAGTISKILTGLSPEALGITSLGVRKK